MEYEIVIGLEIHLELQTKSKLFCGCSTSFGQEPNTNCCPVCLGLPGSLPVFNRRAIELAVTAALALNSDIQNKSRFDRKNYFYPDLPKAYQISQFDLPLARGGSLIFTHGQETITILLERIHLEEEAGKLIHAGDSIFNSAYSLVDYNRAGIPLLEIVTKPELHSGSDARLFLEELKTILFYTGASDCKMEEGSLRCDANISLRPEGSVALGTKTEVKNMNSFRAVEMALNSEAERQRSILEDGGIIIQQTCHWDEEKKETVPLRGKEGSSDYRYFPEPDLLPLVLDEQFVGDLKNSLPELPEARRQRLVKTYQLGTGDADLLTENKGLGDFYEVAAKEYKNHDQLIKWVKGDLLFQLRDSGKEVEDLKPELFVELLSLLDQKVINRPTAKELLAEIVLNAASPLFIVREKGLGRIAGQDQLLPLIVQVLQDNPEAVENYAAGKEKAIGFLVGKVMAATGGRADPQELNRLLKEQLSK